MGKPPESPCTKSAVLAVVPLPSFCGANTTLRIQPRIGVPIYKEWELGVRSPEGLNAVGTPPAFRTASEAEGFWV